MADIPVRGIVLNAGDNVAVALNDCDETTEAVEVKGIQGLTVWLTESIPRGHKFSVRQILAGEPVVKYGEVIGMATSDIPPGALVHVHNVASQRGRGDLRRTGNG